MNIILWIGVITIAILVAVYVGDKLIKRHKA